MFMFNAVSRKQDRKFIQKGAFVTKPINYAKVRAVTALVCNTAVPKKARGNSTDYKVQGRMLVA